MKKFIIDDKGIILFPKITCIHTTENIIYFLKHRFLKDFFYSQNNNRLVITDTKLSKSIRCNIGNYTTFVIDNTLIGNNDNSNELNITNSWLITVKFTEKDLFIEKEGTQSKIFDLLNTFTSNPIEFTKIEVNDLCFKSFNSLNTKNYVNEKDFLSTNTNEVYLEEELFILDVHTTIEDEITRDCCRRTLNYQNKSVNEKEYNNLDSDLFSKKDTRNQLEFSKIKYFKKSKYKFNEPFSETSSEFFADDSSSY